MGSLSSNKSLLIESSLVVDLSDLTIDGLNIRSELSQLGSQNIDLLRVAIKISGSLISCSFGVGHSEGESGNFRVESGLSAGKGRELGPPVGLEVVPELRQDGEDLVVLSF